MGKGIPGMGTVQGLIAAAGLALAALAHAQADVPVDGARLAADLRKGGYILYFRHTATLPEHEHEAKHRRDCTHRLEDCTTQRNLSELGYLQAREQADRVATLGIPMGEVFASRYCRARIHAAFFTARLSFSDPITPVRNPEKAAALKRMLNAPPAPGTNTFLFAHGGILWQATDYDSVEAETFVFRPGPKGAELVATIRMHEWAALAAGRPCCAPRPYWSGQGTPPVE